MNHKLRLIANCTQFAIELRWISIVRLIALLLCSAATVAWCRMRMPNACWNAPSPTPLLCVHISCVTLREKNTVDMFLTRHFCSKSLLCMYVPPIIQNNIWIYQYQIRNLNHSVSLSARKKLANTLISPQEKSCCTAPDYTSWTTYCVGVMCMDYGEPKNITLKYTKSNVVHPTSRRGTNQFYEPCKIFIYRYGWFYAILLKVKFIKRFSKKSHAEYSNTLLKYSQKLLIRTLWSSEL